MGNDNARKPVFAPMYLMYQSFSYLFSLNISTSETPLYSHPTFPLQRKVTCCFTASGFRGWPRKRRLQIVELSIQKVTKQHT